jgi:hypothetical protein
MVPLNPLISIGLSSFSRLHGNFMGNVNPGLINPRLFNWGGTISVAIYYYLWGTTTINQPGFINPGLTLYIIFRHPHFPHFTGKLKVTTTELCSVQSKFVHFHWGLHGSFNVIFTTKSTDTHDVYIRSSKGRFPKQLEH